MGLPTDSLWFVGKHMDYLCLTTGIWSTSLLSNGQQFLEDFCVFLQGIPSPNTITGIVSRDDFFLSPSHLGQKESIYAASTF